MVAAAVFAVDCTFEEDRVVAVADGSIITDDR